MTKYLIIGSGVAGIGAAEAILDQDPGAELKILANEKHGFYSCPGLAYFLTGEIPEKSLFPTPPNGRLQGCLKRSAAVRIDREAHQVLLADGTAEAYDRLLVATGATATLPPVPGVELEGVIKLDNLDDALRITGLARKGRTAVVVGGGITALEIVEGLAARGLHTHYFLRGERYWSSVLDETESRLVERHLQESGVKIHFNTELAAITGEKGRVKGVRTQDQRVLACDLVGLAIGIVPRKDLAAACGLKTERGVLVNEYMQTSDPAIYAAGDVAQIFDPHTGRYTLDSLWGSAREQGRTAGLNMAGVETPYQKCFSFNITRLAGLTTTILGSVGSGRDADVSGIVRGESESFRHSANSNPVNSGLESNRVRLMVGEKTIEGAIVMGDQSLSNILQDLVGQQVDISPIRPQLFDPAVPLNELLVGFWNQWNNNRI